LLSIFAKLNEGSHILRWLNLILYLRISSPKEDPVKFVIFKTQIFYELCTSDYYREDISH